MAEQVFDKRYTAIYNKGTARLSKVAVQEDFMRGGYRGKPKPKLPPHLKRVHINARIQKWMLDQLKKKGEVGIVLESILIEAGFKCQSEK